MQRTARSLQYARRLPTLHNRADTLLINSQLKPPSSALPTTSPSSDTPVRQFHTPSDVSSKVTLVRLPLELLQAIFDLAYPSPSRPDSFLCRALAPVIIRIWWKSLRCDGAPQIGEFCELVKNRPEVARLVESFEASERLSWRQIHSRDTATQHRTVDELVPKSTDLFNTCVNLTRVSLAGDFKAVHRLLSPFFKPLGAPNLAELSIASDFEGVSDPFHPRIWQALSKKSALHTLSITLHPAGNTVSPPLPPFTKRIAPFTSLTHLNLRFAEEYDGDGILQLAAALVALTSITLDLDYEPFLHLHAFFTALPSPSLLRNLHLSAHTSDYEPFPVDLLLLFPSLETLTFTGGNLIALPAFFDILRHLPRLQHLHIGHDSFVLDPTDLVHLLHGPTQHTSLRLLRLDHLNWVRRGPSVELKGSIREDLEVLKEYEAERKVVEERWGDAPPPFSPAELKYYTQWRTVGEP